MKRPPRLIIIIPAACFAVVLALLAVDKWGGNLVSDSGGRAKEDDCEALDKGASRRSDSSVKAWYCGADDTPCSVKAVQTNGTLRIKGKGEMRGYGLYGLAPWRGKYGIFWEFFYEMCGYDLESGERITDNCLIVNSTITDVIVEKGVTRIGDRAFAGLIKLKSVTIPASVTSIGEDAFSGCENLTSIKVAAGNACYSSVNGVLLSKDKKTQIHYPLGKFAFSGCVDSTSVTIPAGATGIYYKAFHDCAKLTSVSADEGNQEYSSVNGVLFSKTKDTLILYPRGRQGAYAIPNGVTIIDEFAFANCVGLTSVTIPKSVMIIKTRAFIGCTGLTSVAIPNDVNYIGWSAFGGCSGLTSVTIGDSLTEINGVFDSCFNLTSIKVSENNPEYRSVDGVLFNKTKDTLILYPRGRQGAYAIPSGVTDINKFAFANCAVLTSVTIPNSVTEIKWREFAGCTGLTSVAIPNSVTYINVESFERCVNLTSLNVSKDNPAYRSVDGVLFNKAKDLLILYPHGRQGAYVIPSGVTDIGWWAFNRCAGLTSLTIPGSVETFDDRAFWYCSALRSVTIGNGLTAIPTEFFETCTGLTSVVSLNPVPPGLGLGLKKFDDLFKEVCIYVPESSIDAYRAAAVWDKFECIKAITDKDTAGTEMAGLDGTGTLTDERDAKTYKTAVIGGRRWMAENMNYLPQSGKSWCFDNDTSNCGKYGRLYDWNTARTVCPAGWRLPSRREWKNLAQTAEDWSGGNAGLRLKARKGWDKIEKFDGNGTDDYGFSALPGGSYNNFHNQFLNAGLFGSWWSAAEFGFGSAYDRSMGSYPPGYMNEGNSHRGTGLSVRCVADRKGD
ncbi:MAG: leucine-rich repeat protein [Chitinispirillales bacterium]|jgi:uncharacterized protein (TIGR02145 family)|nr:leucine-rich repeat protein [Chitinispirillales bacterium]